MAQLPEENDFWKMLPDEILTSVYQEITPDTSPADLNVPTLDLRSVPPIVPAPPVLVHAEAMQATKTTLQNVERFLLEHEQQAQQAPGGTSRDVEPARIKATLSGITSNLQQCKTLHSSHVLEFSTVHKIRTLVGSLLLLRAKTLLLQQAQPISLHIVDQPLPQVVFKGKSIEPYTVQVLTRPGFKEHSLSKMQAIILLDDLPVGTVVPPSPVENDAVRIDTFQRIALFNELKLAVSSRMIPVSFTFRMQVHTTSGQSFIAESERSRPLIVITNESQWSDAAGKLLHADAFEGELEIPWPQFANTLHAHVIAATRQDPLRPSRTLSDADWFYIHSKFFEKLPIARASQATAFWQFFGPAVASLRFKRHISQLWFAGLIYGFASKETCNSVLAMQEVGTFLIRFSESSPGLFTVAYVSDDPFERVKHYLVKQEDLSLNKTLPDVLREKPQFNHILQLEISTGALRRYPRDAVFSAYYSKNRKVPTAGNTSGYVCL